MNNREDLTRPDEQTGGPSRRVLPAVSYLMWVYNEEQRVGEVLAHAVQWADEVVVMCKPSTDRTREICASFGPKVRIVDIAFTPQGHDDFLAAARVPANDWIWIGTASEVPTRELVRRCLTAIAAQPDLDLVQVPRKIYSFGHFDEKSPWTVCHYPYLFHRERVILSNQIHRNMADTRNGRTLAIEYAEDCCVHHFTHATAAGYISAMSQYFEAERKRDDPGAGIEECLANLQGRVDLAAVKGTQQFGVECAWRIYWLGTALHLWEESRGEDAREIYKKERARLAQAEWSTGGFAPGEGVDAKEIAESFAVWKPGTPITSEDSLLGALRGRAVCAGVETLFQVGAHRFQEKELLFQVFPNLKRVVLFEPMPELFESLRKQEAGDPRVTVLPYAISSSNGQSDFHVSSNDAASSSLLKFGAHSQLFPHVTEVGKITVETRRLEDVIREHGLPFPDVLFLDVQGAEYEIIASLSPGFLRGLKMLYTEASQEEVYAGARTLDEIIRLVEASLFFAAYVPLCNEAMTHGNALFVNHDLLFLARKPLVQPAASAVKKPKIDPAAVQSALWSRAARAVLSGKMRRSARRRLDALKTRVRKSIASAAGSKQESAMTRWLRKTDHHLSVIQAGLKTPDKGAERGTTGDQAPRSGGGVKS